MDQPAWLSPSLALKTAYVSALHFVPNLLVDARRSAAAPTIMSILGEEGVIVDGRPPAFGPQTQIATIVAWRERVGLKYRAQLCDELEWDESSNFHATWPVGFDLALVYAAAALDQQDNAALAQMTSAMPSFKDMHALLDRARKRGFSGRFPQILLGQKFWLPFRPTLMIEEPDWRGRLQRFGSVQGLSQELTYLRDALVQLHPELTGVRADVIKARRLPAIWQAWVGSEVWSKACGAAQVHALPLWVRGI